MKKISYIYYIMSDNSFAGINFDDKESAQIFEQHKNTMCPAYKNLNERIRDMIYAKDSNKIYLYLESSGSIGILSSPAEE